MSEVQADFEMKDFSKELLKKLGVEDYKSIPDRLLEIAIKHDIKKISEIQDLLPNIERDWLLEVFQFFLADRENKKQDYTPDTLSQLVSDIIGKTDNVADICAGSGSLFNKLNATFYAEELDEEAAKIGIFNAALRGKTGTFSIRDALGVTNDRVFELRKNGKYSIVDEALNILDLQNGKFTSVISNPPYNIRYSIPDDGRFPIAMNPSNANYSFVFRGLELLNGKGRAIFILPNGVLSSDNDLHQKKWLIDNDYLESVVTLPDRMFAATSIPVCLLVFNKSKKNVDKVTMIDFRKTFDVEIRQQRGEGGKSNTERLYKKEFAVLGKEKRKLIVDFINSENVKETAGIVKRIGIEEIQAQNYNLQPARYIEAVSVDDKSRNLEYIIEDLQRIAKEKSRVKITINKTTAKELGFNDEYLEYLKKSDEQALAINESLKLVNLPEIKSDRYFTTSANKVLKIEVDIKDGYVPSFIKMMMPSFNTLIHHWNEEENRYLSELRDTLLPLLMSGELKIGATE